MQQPPTQDGGTGNELRSDAQQLSSSAANRLHAEVDTRKSTAVTQAQSLSAAIGQAVDGLDPNSPEWLKSALQQGAQHIQRFADSIEQKDSRQLMSDAQQFARKNPGTFLAACAAAGFAAARVLKAGGAQSDHQADAKPASADGHSGAFNRAPTDYAGGTTGWNETAALAPGNDAALRADAPGGLA
jgi:hypothetical protein